MLALTVFNMMRPIGSEYSIGWAVHILIMLLVAALIFGLFYFIISKIPVGDPVKSWLYVALYIVAALVAIFWLLSFAGVTT